MVGVPTDPERMSAEEIAERDTIVVQQSILNFMKKLGFEADQILESLKFNKHDPAAATYHILEEYERKYMPQKAAGDENSADATEGEEQVDNSLNAEIEVGGDYMHDGREVDGEGNAKEHDGNPHEKDEDFGLEITEDIVDGRISTTSSITVGGDEAAGEPVLHHNHVDHLSISTVCHSTSPSPSASPKTHVPQISPLAIRRAVEQALRESPRSPRSPVPQKANATSHQGVHIPRPPSAKKPTQRRGFQGSRAFAKTYPKKRTTSQQPRSRVPKSARARKSSVPATVNRGSKTARRSSPYKAAKNTNRAERGRSRSTTKQKKSKLFLIGNVRNPSQERPTTASKDTTINSPLVYKRTADAGISAKAFQEAFNVYGKGSAILTSGGRWLGFKSTIKGGPAASGRSGRTSAVSRTSVRSPPATVHI